LRAGGLGAVPAAAFPLDQLVLDHRDRDVWQVEDLAALDAGDRHHHQAQPDATTTADRDPASSACLLAEPGRPAVPCPAVITGA